MSDPFLSPVPWHTANPGWYPDPWQQADWRWWDGRAWTGQLAASPRKKPFLPGWLSVPVLVAAPITVLLLILTAITSFIAIPLGLIPLLIVLPVLGWLDRVEPEPLSGRYHAVLWGATVAVSIAFIINSAVGFAFGDEVAAVFSAPIVEEAAKGLGVLFIVRRREIDGVIDGIVYASWVAIGFAVVEDMVYLADGGETGDLLVVFILRVLLTPFAHPLFTFWIRLAVVLAIARGRSVFPYFLWGYALAVLTHMTWNGTLVLSELVNEGIVLVGILVFVCLFAIVVTALIIARRRQQRLFSAAVPWLAQRYGLTEKEVMLFVNWRVMLSYRRRLPRAQRKRFDAVHAALARLAVLHARPVPIDRQTEEVLVSDLHDARYG